MSGEITLDLVTHQARYHNTEHTLSAREFALMHAFMQRPGAILSRAQIEQRIYGWGEEVESNAVDFLIHEIRKKFGKDIIRNVRGAGWMVVKSET
jgi:two-component system OmpR family response regulator